MLLNEPVEIAVPEEGTDRHFEHVFPAPYNDLCLDTVSIAEPSGGIDEIGDHVNTLLLNA